MALDEQETSAVRELGVSTAKRGVIYVGGEIATSVITLVLLIFLARVLQPSSFGLYSIAVAFSTFLGIAGNFGMGTAFRKMLPELRAHESSRINGILANGYYVAMSLGLAIAVAGFLLSHLIAVNLYHNASLTAALQIAAIAEFVSVIFNLGQAALVGLGLVREATVANVAYSAFYLVGSVLLVVMGYGVAGAVSGMLLGLAVGAAVGVWYTLRKTGVSGWRASRATAKEVTSFSAPVVASNVAMQGVMNFSVLFLGIFAITSVVGNYGSAYKLARFVDLMMASVTFILLAAFSRALSDKSIADRIGSIYNNSLYYTALLVLPIAAYGIALAKPLVSLLFSAHYLDAPFYFAVIVAGMAVGMIGLYAGTLIIGNGDTRRFMKYQIFAVALQLVLLVLLTPVYKALGVLLALFVITPIALDIVYIRALNEQFRIKHRFGGLGRVALASVLLGLVMFAVAYAMHQSWWALVVDLAVLVLLTPALLSLVRGVTRKNLEFMESTGKRFGRLHILSDAYVRYIGVFMRGGGH